MFDFDEEFERDAWEALQLDEEGRWRQMVPEDFREAEDFMPMPEEEDSCQTYQT